MSITVVPVRGLPLVQPGDDLSGLISSAIEKQGITPRSEDIVVVAQKMVSKAERRLVSLDSVIPSAKAALLAKEVERDPRLMELVLRESVEIVRKKPGVLIVRNKLGIVAANAGIDQSNINHDSGEWALLLPKDPDRSAQKIRYELQEHFGVEIGVVVSDSAHRPWRLGSVAIAIGISGVCGLDDKRGGSDIFGRELHATVVGRGDAIATAAALVMGESDEGVPTVIVRGMKLGAPTANARRLLRPIHEDLFR